MYHLPAVSPEKTEENEFTSNVADDDESGLEAAVLHKNSYGQGLLAVEPAGQKLPELHAAQALCAVFPTRVL